MGNLKPITNKRQFMLDLYGHDYLSDSNRTRTGSYMVDGSPNPCDLHDAAKTFGRTSEYGPGMGEKCTAEHLRPEVLRIARRSERRGLPYKIVWHGKYVASLGVE
jgi:hypothetical protein